MESLLDRVRTAETWDPAIIDEILDRVREAKESGSLDSLADAVAPALGEGPSSQPARFVNALTRAAGGDASERERVESILESLNQSGLWDALARLAVGSAEILSEPALCRYVVRAGEVGGVEALPDGTLARALELAPANHRLIWLEGLLLEAGGQESEAADRFAVALPGFARAKDIDRVDEGILRLAEKPSRELWRPLWSALDQLARGEETRPLVAFLELALPNIEAAGLIDEVWDTLRRLLEHGQSTRKIRALAGKVASIKHKSLKSIDQVVEKSGLASPKGSIEKALAEFDRLLRFAPGLIAVHKGFGAGTVVDNDGNVVTIDFPERAAHRMSLEIAERSLDILPPDDLATFVITEPERMKKTARKDPVELLVLALKKLGGEGANAEIRKHLVPGVISAQSWPAWWKRATAAAANDERIDTSQVFRRVYRLADGEASSDAGLLPRIQEKTDLHQNVEMIRHFLDQHPENEDEARRVYRPRLANWLASSTKSAERLHILLLLHHWQEATEEAFFAEIEELVRSGGDFSFTSLESEQLDLLNAAAAAGRRVDGAMAAFPCRNAVVRRRAAELIAGALGDDLTRHLRDAYSRSPRDEARVMGLVEFALEEPDALPAALADPWLATRGIIAIVHAASREPARRQALSLLKRDGKLSDLLRRHRPDEESHHLVLTQLTGWRTTDRHLFPVLEFLEDAGASAIVEDVKKHRSERSAELLQKTRAASDMDSGLLMSRAGIDRLREEILEIQTALRTTIPETILRAREMGDLKENAEYHAAKDKQRTFNVRLGDLQNRLTQARAIEDLSRSPGVVAPGTEVHVRDLDDETEQRYWLLGDGDSFQGDNVISYRAPLGTALSGRQAGEEVVVSLEGRERRLEILSVSEKLP